MTFNVFTPDPDFESWRRLVRVRFRYRESLYDLRVTDPIAESKLLAGPDGSYPLERDSYFCVSLAEAHTDGNCYKLAATVITELPL